MMKFRFEIMNKKVFVDELFQMKARESQAFFVGSRNGHYDLTPAKRRRAVALGAIECTPEQLLRKVKNE